MRGFFDFRFSSGEMLLVLSSISNFRLTQPEIKWAYQLSGRQIPGGGERAGVGYCTAAGESGIFRLPRYSQSNGVMVSP
jgi:hypothetical protein